MEAIKSVLVAVLFICLVPLAYVLTQVRRRQLSDHHVSLREQRPVPFLVAIGSVIVGLALLRTLGAPQMLLALIVAMLAGLAVSLLVTLAWKISMHVATLSGAVVIVLLVFGPWLLPIVALVILQGWARMQLRDHTLGQVLSGAAVGATVAAAVFLPLR